MEAHHNFQQKEKSEGKKNDNLSLKNVDFSVHFTIHILYN